MIENDQLFSLKDASEWATSHLGKKVTPSNITYLIQYGRIKKMGNNGTSLVSMNDLANYYNSYNGKREVSWKDQLGEDLNWALSFDKYTEAETTKHVHRLHPYKGKFIPQLVEYFLDGHTDSFKINSCFKPGDIILDPFSGSGTTMVQACELGMHAIGIDISAFNSLISNCKVKKYDLIALHAEFNRITHALSEFVFKSHIPEFEEALLQALYEFNNLYFPVPDYKYRLRQGLINESKYGSEKEREFLPIFNSLVKKHKVTLQQTTNDRFLDKWYSQHIREEIHFAFEQVMSIQDANIKNLASVVLSRTIRSCRATTHADLATLVEPITSTYYCAKHGKICKPLFSILKWWESYTKDTLRRLAHFERLKTQTFQACFAGDSRSIDIYGELGIQNSEFSTLVKKKKIKGIFSSPPYVGLIDYHEQHAYAYDLFEFERKDESEIGPLFKGQGREARQSYIEGISLVLNNCKKFLADDFDVFLVANDKYNMYPTIAANAEMQIVNQFRRPVLNRTERDKGAYSETIFHMKGK